MDQVLYHIPFNRPLCLGTEQDSVCAAFEHTSKQAIASCEQWFKAATGAEAAYFMASCTQALEMAVLLAGIGPGDEVIMPSYTFVSTANAVALRGAVPVFVDTRLDTCNLDEQLIEAAITAKTRAIMPVHYGGVACDMAAIMAIAEQHGLIVIEDAAHGVMARWRGQALGSIAQLGAYSFHATKNYTSGGEGGLLLVNSDAYTEQAAVVRDMGTIRAAFFSGQCASYEWLSLGGSYHASELQAAALSAQLARAGAVNERRLTLWNRYAQALAPFCEHHGIAGPTVPEGCEHNGHLFYLRFPDARQRDRVQAHMARAGVQAASHYRPLHEAPAARRFARTAGRCDNARLIADTILRLPLYLALTDAEQDQVIDSFQAAVRGHRAA